MTKIVQSVILHAPLKEVFKFVQLGFSGVILLFLFSAMQHPI